MPIRSQTLGIISYKPRGTCIQRFLMWEGWPDKIQKPKQQGLRKSYPHPYPCPQVSIILKLSACMSTNCSSQLHYLLAQVGGQTSPWLCLRSRRLPPPQAAAPPAFYTAQISLSALHTALRSKKKEALRDRGDGPSLCFFVLQGPGTRRPWEQALITNFCPGVSLHQKQKACQCKA